MNNKINLSFNGPIAMLTMARPDVHNAFDADMIAELHNAFIALAADERVRMVILTGAGSSFCAGGDVRWMQASLEWSNEQNRADATALAALFEAAWRLPKLLIGRINGPAIGGGAGLVACCDLAVATDTTRFGFGEVKLGLIPAVIAQYIVPKIGISHARALFLSGERFSAERAFEIGLIHAITTETDLDATINTLAHRGLSSGPQAIAATKQVLEAVTTMDRAMARQYVIEALATIRTGPEAQEGIRAFLEKRRPSWGG